MKKLYIIFIITSLSVGCTTIERRAAISACQTACQQVRTDSSVNIFVGPCINENIKPDWSCDVTHNPRQPIDDDPRNQCGSTVHIVELDTNCDVLQAE